MIGISYGIWDWDLGWSLGLRWDGILYGWQAYSRIINLKYIIKQDFYLFMLCYNNPIFYQMISVLLKFYIIKLSQDDPDEFIGLSILQILDYNLNYRRIKYPFKESFILIIIISLTQ